MHSPSPKFRPRARTTAAVVAFALVLFVAVPSFAATERGPDRALDRPGIHALSALWAAWLEIWEPITTLFAADGEEGTSGGGLGPGGGSGLLDPNG